MSSSFIIPSFYPFKYGQIGCGYVSSTITVIDYPLYFTPNGDGTNDTWNITDTQG